MESHCLAIDGSAVTVQADGVRRAGPTTTAGWAIAPSMMRAHPFVVYPPGQSRVMEAAIRQNFPAIELTGEEELSLKDGTLRVGEVSIPRDGGDQRISVAAWEGEHGCMTTSLSAGRVRALIETFDTLQFTDGEEGLVIDSPVVTQPRPPEVVQEVDGLGIMVIRPAVATELERMPRSPGMRTRRGELFRVRADSRALVFLGSGAVVRVQPSGDLDDTALAEALDGLDVQWVPRRAPRATG